VNADSLNLFSYRLVVFDWEGTLSDTIGHIFALIQTEALALGLCQFDMLLAKQYLGLGLVGLIRHSFPDASPTQLAVLLENVEASMVPNHGLVYLVPGMLDFVKVLHSQGVFLAIASNKSLSSLNRSLDLSGMRAYFPVVRSGSECAPKPAPDMLLELMDYYQVSVAETVMIGDSEIDMLMAQSALVDAVGVDFYGQTRGELETAGAISVAHDICELYTIFNLE
jgi:phosphoglycolate phosphatase